MPAIAVTKCQGTGNDFVVLDNRERREYAYGPLARSICDRRFGIGADGLLVLLPPETPLGDASMRIFNADGSEAETCGNGIRCLARFVWRGEAERPLAFETRAGLVRVEPAGAGLVRVMMGVPALARPFEVPLDFDGRAERVARVSMGNPHAVIFFDGAIESVALERLAAAVADLGLDPAGVNVEIAILAGARINMRVWERGVGETWACGSGAAATAVAAIASGRARTPVEVAMRGGSVAVTWNGESTPVSMTGPAVLVFDTAYELSGDLVPAAGG